MSRPQPETYVPIPIPSMESSQKLYLENQLREIAISIESLKASVETIYEELDALTP